MIRARLCALLCLIPLIGGCVMLERAPAALTCDSDLAGHWVPLAGSASGSSPLNRDDYADVDAQCRVTLVDAKQPNERPSFTALGFRIGEARYLALTQAAMRELFNDRAPAKPSALPDTAVLPMRYRIVDDVLELQTPDATALQALIKQGELKALDTGSAYLLQGDEAALNALMTERADLFGVPAPVDDPGGPGSGVLRLKRTGAAP